MSTITELPARAVEEEKIDDNDRIIRLTQDMREKMIRALAPEGVVPTDPNQLNMLLKVLDSASGTAVGVKRIKNDEKQAQSNEALALAIAQGARAVMSGGRLPVGGTREVEDRPVIDVPGQTLIGVHPVMSESILGDDTIDALQG